jgi:DNA-binding response OmpR family regulator
MAVILLLETDRQLAKNMQAYFSRAGHQLSYYADPQAAVMGADTSRPDIVILDLFLASRSGIEFLYELRSYPEWQTIPVIITGRLPADELGAYQESFKELGVSKYLPKQTTSLDQFLAEAERTLQPAAA